MTVLEWLNNNHEYDEAIMIDANGNECMFWNGNNDPKYKSHVIRVENRDSYGCTANVYTDYIEK